MNEYTLVLDVLFAAPTGPHGWTAVLNLDGANRRFDNIWYRWNGKAGNELQYGDGVINTGFKTTLRNAVPAGTWVRLAYRVAVREGYLHEDLFVDGENVSVYSADPIAVDGRGSAPAAGDANPYIALWGHNYPHSNAHGTAFLNSAGFFGRPLTDEEIGSLGGPSSGGIPTSVEERSGVEPASSVLRQQVFERPARDPVFAPPVPPVAVRAQRLVPMLVPGAHGAPYFSTHDISEAIVIDGSDVYFSYFGNGSYVVKYNRHAKRWVGPVLLGGVSDDQYRYPEIIMDHDGYLHAFYGGHGWVDRTERFLYRRTVRPRDITAWTPETEVAHHGSFPKPYVLKDGRLVLFHRGSNGGPKGANDYGWGYIESRDRGKTWSGFRRLVAEELVLYGGGKLEEKLGEPPVLHWGWGWWDNGVCDIGHYYSPNIAVPCKYDAVVYAAFSIGEGDIYRLADGSTHRLPVKRNVIEPIWQREWLIVTDSALDAEGNPVILFGDYDKRRVSRMLVATHTGEKGWVIEEPMPGVPVAFNNLRIRHAGGWITIVGLAGGKDPGLFIAQRRAAGGKFYVRKLTHQAFPYQMHPIFREDETNGLLHVFWAEGDRLTSSRIVYASVPIDPARARK